MEGQVFRVPDVPTQSYRSFRTMAEAELALPTAYARMIASRIEIPWHLIVRRRIQAIVNFELVKKKENENA